MKFGMEVGHKVTDKFNYSHCAILYLLYTYIPTKLHFINILLY